MNIPDSVSPIVAYRVWRWDGSGLASLRGESWPTGHALKAQCPGLHVGSHLVPQESCTCGIYAARSPDQLSEMGYAAFAICGEVYLWGVVVEHKLGWRAQFAYPKNLVVPFEMIPVDEKQAQYFLEALIAYGVDVFIDDGEEQRLLWEKGSGYEPAGLDYVRKVVSGQVEGSVPVAVLKEDPSRHVLLQNGRVVNHSAEIVFTDIRFSVNAPDPITYQLKAPHVVAVVFDLRPGNARLTRHAINLVRMACTDIRTFTTNIAILVRVDSDTHSGVARGIGIMPVEYLEREGRNDVQSAYERFLRRGARSRGLTLAVPRYRVVSLLLAAFAVMVVVSLYLHGPTVRFARDVVFLMMALPLAMISWQDRVAATAPDIITLPGTMLGVLTAAIPGAISMPDVRALCSLTHSYTVSIFIPVAVSIAGAAISLSFLLCIGARYRRRRGYEGIGMGAVKSAMMIGAFCGVAGGVFALFLSFLLGSLFGLLMMIRYRSMGWRTVYRTKKIPFVPFIVVAGIVSLLWG